MARASRILTFTSLILFFGFGLSSTISCSSPATPPPIHRLLLDLPPTTLTAKDFALKRMADAGISPELRLLLQTVDLNDKVVSYNVLGFLAHADYSVHYSGKALKKCRAFAKKYKKTLSYAQKKFGISKESIVGLLWVETKFGKQMGTYSLPEVYFSLLQADHPEVIKKTLSDLSTREPAALQTNPQFTEITLQNKVVERSLKKSAWALSQLKVIDQIFKKENPKILSLKSSYAGAFGVPQFIPSTYQDFAISAHHQSPNLFKTSDAILSVAHFLNQKGWIESDPESKSKALYEYNHSKDYGDVILKIAAQLQKS
jgi:membrane-bound lytic murein transglycosylase B